jgi:hypothetical protein
MGGHKSSFSMPLVPTVSVIRLSIQRRRLTSSRPVAATALIRVCVSNTGEIGSLE